MHYQSMVYPRSGDNYVIYYGDNVSTRLGKATNKTKKSARLYFTQLPVLYVYFRCFAYVVPPNGLLANEFIN